MKQIQSVKAPIPVGPYSQAISVGGFLFCSGQIGLDPKTGVLVRGGIVKETEQVLNNLSEVLSVAGTALEKVVRVDLFLTDMNDFQIVNEVYPKYFVNIPRPARQTVKVAGLSNGAKVEISCIAYLK